jgi:hypothetical protein
MQLTPPVAAFAVAALFAALVATCLRIAWNPPAATYVHYVPIAAVFASFFWDRLFPRISRTLRHAICDFIVVALSLMRVFVPPLPFVSGHTLFASYAALTAQRWPLRAIALVALAEVVYTKLFASGGWLSMVGGFAMAALLAAGRHSPQRPDSEPARVAHRVRGDC